MRGAEMMRTRVKSWQVAVGVTALVAASLGGVTAAQADHVAQVGPSEGGFLGAGDCYVGEEAFAIPDRGYDGEYFGVGLLTTDIKRDVVKGDRTLAYTCKFTGVPTSLRAYDPSGPEEQPGTIWSLVEDYTVPKGGFTAGVTCWDRYNEGLVEGWGTIKISHRGTAMLKCDLRAAYAELDAQS